MQHTCQKFCQIIYVPMEETIKGNINVSVGDFNLSVKGASYILAGYEPQGYMLSYCSLVKKSIFLKVLKNLWSFHSIHNIVSDDNFKKFDASLTISYILDIYDYFSTIATLFPLSGQLSKYLYYFVIYLRPYISIKCSLLVYINWHGNLSSRMI